MLGKFENACPSRFLLDLEQYFLEEPFWNFALRVYAKFESEIHMDLGRVTVEEYQDHLMPKVPKFLDMAIATD